MKKLEQLKKNLEKLDAQAALYGMAPPLHLLNDIEYHKIEIEKLEAAEASRLQVGKNLIQASRINPERKLNIFITTIIITGILAMGLFLLPLTNFKSPNRNVASSETTTISYLDSTPDQQLDITSKTSQAILISTSTPSPEQPNPSRTALVSTSTRIGSPTTVTKTSTSTPSPEQPTPSRTALVSTPTHIRSPTIAADTTVLEQNAIYEAKLDAPVLRIKPSQGEDIILDVPAGARITVLSPPTGPILDWGSYMKVRYKDFTGWVIARQIRPVNNNDLMAKRAEVINLSYNGVLFVRDRPNKELSEIIARLGHGAEVYLVTSEPIVDNRWQRIRVDDIEGWVDNTYLAEIASPT